MLSLALPWYQLTHLPSSACGHCQAWSLYHVYWNLIYQKLKFCRLSFFVHNGHCFLSDFSFLDFCCLGQAPFWHFGSLELSFLFSYIAISMWFQIPLRWFEVCWSVKWWFQFENLKRITHRLLPVFAWQDLVTFCHSLFSFTCI